MGITILVLWWVLSRISKRLLAVILFSQTVLKRHFFNKFLGSSSLTAPLLALWQEVWDLNKCCLSTVLSAWKFFYARQEQQCPSLVITILQWQCVPAAPFTCMSLQLAFKNHGLNLFGGYLIKSFVKPTLPLSYCLPKSQSDLGRSRWESLIRCLEGYAGATARHKGIHCWKWELTLEDGEWLVFREGAKWFVCMAATTDLKCTNNAIVGGEQQLVEAGIADARLADHIQSCLILLPSALTCTLVLCSLLLVQIPQWWE